MVKEKKIDDAAYGKLMKELTSISQMIRIDQKEKQATMDSFDREVKMYRAGKISQKALRASVPKTSKVVQKLDKTLKGHIQRAVKAHRRAIALMEKQDPNKFKVTMHGMKTAGTKKKAAKKKKR